MSMDENYTFFYFTKTYRNESAKSELTDVQRLNEEDMINRGENEIYSPSEYVLKKIMDFSKSYDVVKTASTGYVELNLN